MSSEREKRKIQRIRLDCPIVAQIGSAAVILVDLSTVGARLEHDFPLAAGKDLQLHLTAGGESVLVDCIVTRCKLERGVSGGVAYCTGVKFVDPHGEPVSVLRRVIAEYVQRDLEARRAHAGRRIAAVR